MAFDASSTTNAPAAETLTVMVVDDTITYRSILSKILSTLPEVGTTVTASNGKIALSKLETTPCDLVLLDIEMPEMDGLECLSHIKKLYPNTMVVMVSGMNRSSADITIKALESGALDFIPKPDGSDMESNTQELQVKLTQVFKHFLTKRKLRPALNRPSSSLPVSKPAPASPSLSTASTPVISKSSAAPPTAAKPVTAPLPHTFEVVAIGVSTGGPNALNEVIPMLPKDLGVPVLLVQHMPAFFTASLAQSLDKRSQLSVKEAEDGDIVLPNWVYIAPGGRHMALKKQPGGQVTIALNDEAPENSCRPAVDVLFRSVANVYGKNILSLIMTGMGNDGAKGVQHLKQVGCYSITQNEQSCVVYGMPRAVDEMQLSDESLELGQIASRVTELIKKGRR